jgi:hypothetical protein
MYQNGKGIALLNADVAQYINHAILYHSVKYGTALRNMNGCQYDSILRYRFNNRDVRQECYVFALFL